jgi:hypothetical protein
VFAGALDSTFGAFECRQRLIGRERTNSVRSRSVSVVIGLERTGLVRSTVVSF